MLHVSMMRQILFRTDGRTNKAILGVGFLELIHQVAVDVTVVVCAEDSDRSDPLRITQFVAPPQVYHLISSLIISLHLL